MDNGAKAFVFMMLISLLLGALVVAINPSYRNTMRALAAGVVEQGPIWQSNSTYYEAVQLEEEGADNAE